MESVGNHPWFTGIDWDTLDDKEAQAPFIPDVSIFENIEHVENISVLNDARL